MTGTWRVDHLAAPAMPPTWHADEDAALAEASRLRFAGRVHVVAWLDLATYVPIEEVA